jgi:cyclophilin family peptidyl-prolyl cis-trans isomerase
MGVSVVCGKAMLLPAHVTIPRSQFYITFRATPHLNKKHTVFGKLVGGEGVLDTLEKLPLKGGTERPAKPVRITEIVMWVLSHRV